MLFSSKNFLPLALAAAPHVVALATPQSAVPPPLLHVKRQGNGFLFDLMNLPVPSAIIQTIDLSLVTFADEFFDISNIAIFGTVFDGGVNCTATTEIEAGEEVVLGPAVVDTTSQIDVGSISVSLVTFADEVFDISNISIFGDVIDC